MIEGVRELVSAESPTNDLDLVRACSEVVARVGAEITGVVPEIGSTDGRPYVRWRGSDPRVMLLGHFDTVWPAGTIERWPFEVRDGIATGPGIFDMKAGIVQGLYAAAEAGALEKLDILFTSDEEIGAPTSRVLIEQAARDVDAVLVLEPSQDRALKVARKGVATYRVEARGRAAHAGLEPEKGRSARVEIAHQILAICDISRPPTTVSPTMVKAGPAVNTIPADAVITVDVRALSQAEQDRVDEAMFALRARTPEVELVVERVMQSPPFPRSASAELFARAQRSADKLGLGPLEGAEVGGGSDGNYTASVGTPTLDGLGAVGDGAHAEGEHIVIDEMPKRAGLVSALITDLI
jgi:glutamate carboxypeptidase